MNWLNVLNALDSVVPSAKYPWFTIDESCVCDFDTFRVEYSINDNLDSNVPDLIVCDDDAIWDDDSHNSDDSMPELVHQEVYWDDISCESIRLIGLEPTSVQHVPVEVIAVDWKYLAQ